MGELGPLFLNFLDPPLETAISGEAANSYFSVKPLRFLCCNMIPLQMARHLEILRKSLGQVYEFSQITVTQARSLASFNTIVLSCFVLHFEGSAQ